MQKTYIIALVTALVLAIGGGGYWYYQKQQAAEVASVDYVLQPILDGTYKGTVPSLTYEIQVSPNTPEEVHKTLTEKVQGDQEKLKKIPYDGNTWMDLALYYHAGNDFAAAQEVWDFIVDITPDNVTALNNLGRLYHYDLKDFPKAESYFMKALKANPGRPEAYFELFDLYRYSYKKNTSAAVDIMLDGAQKFPNDYSYYAGIGVYYRDLGNTAKARTYFEKALTVARGQSDLTGISTLTQELSHLP